MSRETEVKLDIVITDGIHTAAENTANNNNFTSLFRDSIKSKIALDNIKTFCQNKENLKRIFALLITTPKKEMIEQKTTNLRKQTVRISKRQQEYINTLTEEQIKEMVMIQTKISMLERKISNTTETEELAFYLASFLSLKFLGVEISI